MTYVGKISKGAIVLPPDVHLPEGTVAEIKPIHVSATEEKKMVNVAQDPAATLKNLRGAGRKHLKPGQDAIAELIAEREREN